MLFDGFDWDDGNRTKCAKHGVLPSEVESIFATSPMIAPDPHDQTVERRYRAVGQSATKRHLFVVFTWRTRDGALLLRPISARFMHLKEVRRYEEDLS